MKKIFLILPMLAFIVLLLNGFFGHSLFTSPYEQDINKYSIYVHFQEDLDRLAPHIEGAIHRVPAFGEVGVKKVYNGAICHKVHLQILLQMQLEVISKIFSSQKFEKFI